MTPDPTPRRPRQIRPQRDAAEPVELAIVDELRAEPDADAPARHTPAARPTSPTPTYAGIAVVLAGFGLIAIAWAGVAGKANVAQQIPYLLSGGLTGIGLVLVGLTVINVAAKRRDAALREQQILILAEALQELRRSTGGRQ